MKPSDFALPRTPKLNAFLSIALGDALKIALREATIKRPETTPAVNSTVYHWPKPWFLASSDSYGNDKDCLSI